MKVTLPLRLLRFGIALIALSGCVVVNGASQSPAASIPLEEAGENYVLIKARVNGSEPLTFSLDSGAGSGLVLYFKAAQALGLKPQGKGEGGGAGEETFATTLVKGVSLSFPGVEMRNQSVVVFPPGKTSKFDRVVDGIIGYTLFKSYIVEVDYQSRVVNLYPPKTYQYTGPGESIPLRIMSHVPLVRMKIPIEGHKPFEGDFIVDLGAGRFNAILNAPLVASHNLVAIAQKTIKDPGAEGVGGEVHLLVCRLPQLQLGSFTLANPVVHLAQDRKGAFASSDFSGVIGGELLRRFKVIFDYEHKRLILEANASLTEPFEYDMSGIRLRAGGEDLKSRKVLGVVENSPAWEAGVRAGDLISTIDGTPVAELSLAQIMHLFKQQDKEYMLEVIRGDEKKQIKLKLRRLV